MVTVAICSSGTMRLLPLTVIGSCSMLAADTRSAGCRRTDTSRVSPVGSTQSPASTPAKATRSACAASPTEMPSELARLRSSSMRSSSCGSCSDRPTSTAPGTSRSRAMKPCVISISWRESGPLKRICTGFCAPLFRSSSTTYSAPTRRAVWRRSSAPISAAVRRRSVLLPMSTKIRPPPGLTKALVARVSGMVRASVAAASTFSRACSRLALGGVRTSTMMVLPSVAGKKLVPPKRPCSASAAARLATAKTAIQRRWCRAQAMTRP